MNEHEIVIIAYDDGEFTGQWTLAELRESEIRAGATTNHTNYWLDAIASLAVGDDWRDSADSVEWHATWRRVA